MYEPKYRLNKKDEASFSELLVRHALEAGKKRHRLYPPLTLEENLEMVRLQKKREEKSNSHPKMQAALRCQRNHDRKLKRMFDRIWMRARALQLISRLKIKVDNKK